VARSKRKITTFSLSFLDIMACGFGAVTLLFLILKHNPITDEYNDTFAVSEKNLLQKEIKLGKASLIKLKSNLILIDESSLEVLQDVKKIKLGLSEELDPKEELTRLRRELVVLEEKIKRLKKQRVGRNIRQFSGDGERQYLTGLKLGGKRIIILVDVSASMLSDSIVNVIRLRNMDEKSKKASPKWQRAIKTTEWLVSQMPEESQYQIYTFNSIAKSISNDDGVWKNTKDKSSLDSSIKKLKNTVPTGGTNLTKAFRAIKDFKKFPDNIFLITDGLPTQGRKKQKNMIVTASDRMKLFQESLKELPSRIPVNILLFPMEGDPFAAASYWKLAISTNGSLMSPSRDWP